MTMIFAGFIPPVQGTSQPSSMSRRVKTPTSSYIYIIAMSSMYFIKRSGRCSAVACFADAKRPYACSQSFCAKGSRISAAAFA
ncbi:hypothetical protein [Ruminococcus sp. NK3A76]|uniref:hypothetical protein n=1 Tax=Ruminococcus sp. NK3A76 TaxID=877411 RepID=UPI0012EC5D12|nr:hypothetical protein [Ruminococcus sp. NK3A76]